MATFTAVNYLAHLNSFIRYREPNRPIGTLLSPAESVHLFKRWAVRDEISRCFDRRS